MQNTASVPPDQFSDLLKRFPADLDLDALALETKAIRRKRKIDGGANLLRLALARGPGGFSHLELTDQHGAEALERGAPIAGEIRIGDRNYARLPVLKRFLAKAHGKADFIVRLGWNALQLSTPRGKPFDLIGYLQHLPAGVRPQEVILRAAAGQGESALPLRLIVQRKTPEATEATRLALRRAAIKKGKKLDPRSLIAAEFMILATSLPKTGYTAKDVLAVYRLRWQIDIDQAWRLCRIKGWVGSICNEAFWVGHRGSVFSSVRIRAADRQAIADQRGRATPARRRGVRRARCRQDWRAGCRAIPDIGRGSP